MAVTVTDLANALKRHSMTPEERQLFVDFQMIVRTVLADELVKLQDLERKVK
jgi:hypothetical protein